MKNFLSKKSFFRQNVVIKLILLSLAIAVYYIVGCQDLSFVGSLNDYKCEEGQVEGVSCHTFDSGTDVERITARLGKADILFVVDDSLSMKEEQESIANQFDQFLTKISRTDYQIAIISTDLNRDGEFLEFPNGETILSNPDQLDAVDAENIDLFQQTIQRSDDMTQSNDERGIAALNRALERGENNDFLRPHSLFVAIIISDEDERSWGGRTPPEYVPGMDHPPPLETIDLPETFFQLVSLKNRFSQVMVHAIIVKPGDKTCLKKSGGIEGIVYAQIAQPPSSMIESFGNIRPGHIASICERNYGSQLSPIASLLMDVVPISLGCFPEPGSISVRINGSEYDNYVLEGRMLHIQDKMHYGAEAEIDYSCLNSL